MKRMMLGLAALGLAACAPGPQGAAPSAPQSAADATAQDTCGASRFQHLIGTRLDAIDPAAMPPGTRLLTPTSMVTRDFRPDRLNVMSGTDGLVSSLQCY